MGGNSAGCSAVNATSLRRNASRAVTILTLAVNMLTAQASPVKADPTIGGRAEGDSVFIAAVEETQRSREETGVPVVSGDQGNSPYVEYTWGVACARPGSPTGSEESGCIAAATCAGPREQLYRLWGRTEAGGEWTPLYTRCFRDMPDEPTPSITPAMVLNELRRVGLPRVEAHTQPASKTLVNFDTILFTEAEPFTTTFTLLGQSVDVVAEPAEYTWHHGDGTTSVTTSPGAPYPSKEIVHRYRDADVTVSLSVDVTYSARFRVNGGTWQDIAETVTIPGPATDLRVVEATPVLSGDYS